jgi:hypothetical protein
MKRWILGVAMTLAVLTALQAQAGPPPDGGSERVKAMRTAFITNELQLTPEEAQVFWPIFNQFEAEQKRVRERYKPSKDLLSMTDAEAEKLLNSQLDMEEEIIQLKRDYTMRFKKILPVRKVAMLSRVEHEFREHLVQRLKDVRGGQYEARRMPGPRNR